MSALFEKLFDDAAIFPPGNAVLTDAVESHRAWRHSAQQSFVGPFICSAPRLAALGALSPDFPVSVTASEVPAGVLAAARHGGIDIVSVELPYDEAAWDDLVTAADVAPIYVEVPLGAFTADLAVRLVSARLRLKLRTGGTTAELFPPSAELADGIVTAARTQLSFKLTAGLHNALRHRDPRTGFEHHGFANILAATAAAEQSAERADVAAILEATDAVRITSLLRALSDSEVETVRHRFLSFGTCSIQEPLDDLVALGLLPRAVKTESPT